MEQSPSFGHGRTRRIARWISGVMRNWLDGFAQSELGAVSPAFYLQEVDGVGASSAIPSANRLQTAPPPLSHLDHTFAVMAEADATLADHSRMEAFGAYVTEQTKPNS
jgi:hypothetical protein